MPSRWTPQRSLDLVTQSGHPLAAAGDDVVELVADHVAEAVVDRAQEAEGDEDPRLRIRVALGYDAAVFLGPPDQARDVVVHLAHLRPERAPDLGIVCSLGQRLDPEVAEHDPGGCPRLEICLADRLEPVRRVLLALDRPLPDHPDLLPDAVEAGQVEIALGREVAVEDRLGDSGLARGLYRKSGA